MAMGEFLGCAGAYNIEAQVAEVDRRRVLPERRRAAAVPPVRGARRATAALRDVAARAEPTSPVAACDAALGTRCELGPQVVAGPAAPPSLARPPRDHDHALVGVASSAWPSCPPNSSMRSKPAAASSARSSSGGSAVCARAPRRERPAAVGVARQRHEVEADELAALRVVEHAQEDARALGRLAHDRRDRARLAVEQPVVVEQVQHERRRPGAAPPRSPRAPRAARRARARAAARCRCR